MVDKKSQVGCFLDPTHPRSRRTQAHDPPTQLLDGLRGLSRPVPSVVAQRTIAGSPARAEIGVPLLQPSDANIFRSLPVAGVVTTAPFLAGFGEDRQRWTGHEEVAARWGAAPVTQQSGKYRTVKRRMACDTTVHQAWIWFSFNTIRCESCWARSYYQDKRKTGMDHYTALRCTAQRWIKITYRLWYDRIQYDEEIHQARRRERQQPRIQI